MNGRSDRRARISRLRTLEHRIAAKKFLSANAKVQDLVQIGRRLAALRQSLTTDVGETSGLMLQNISEMASRLERAKLDLAAPILEAENECEISRVLHDTTHRRAEGALRLTQDAIKIEQYEEDLRRQAAASLGRFGSKGR